MGVAAGRRRQRFRWRQWRPAPWAGGGRQASPRPAQRRAVVNPYEDGAGGGAERGQAVGRTVKRLKERDRAGAAEPGGGPAGGGGGAARAVLVGPGVPDGEAVEAGEGAGGDAGVAQLARVAGAEEAAALEGALARGALQACAVHVVAAGARAARVNGDALVWLGGGSAA